MRIVKETTIEGLKVTIFQMSGKYSVKLETNLLEQTYKFRDGQGMDNVAAVEKLLTSAFIQEVKVIFNSMDIKRGKAIVSTLKDEIEFPEII